MAIDPLTAILDIGGKVIDRLFPDPTERAKAQLELFRLQQSGELTQMTSQLAVNEAEAKNASIFVAGWRPFVGWVCGSAFALNFVVGPLAVFVSVAMGNPIQVPVLDLSDMMPVLLGMLGLGAYRTFEKSKGVEGNR